jgi:hypothetical protein
MSRSHSIVGLKQEAYEFIRKLSIVPDEIEHIEDAFSGMHIYTMHTWQEPETKETYREVIQDEPWSSGPITYTCLQRVSDSKLMYQWSKKEMGVQY